MEKRQEARLFDGLEKARDALTDILADVEQGQIENVVDALEAVDETLERTYKMAERLEGERDER